MNENKRSKEKEQWRKNEEKRSREEENERKTKEKQWNKIRSPIREEKRLYGKTGSLEDVLLTQKVQTDAEEINEETEDWMDLDETEEWKQYEIEEK